MVVERRSTSATRRFAFLLRGASLADYAWLSDFGRIRDNVYVYDHVSKSARHPDANDAGIPWPIIWIMGRYHKNHVLCMKAKPDLQRFIKDISQFEQKMRWRWFFRDDNEKPSIIIKAKRATRPCTVVVYAALEAWLFKPEANDAVWFQVLYV
jgi:hypothetical protein